MSEPIDCPTSQLCINGTFDQDSDWSKNLWTIAGGTANFSWTTGLDENHISQDIPFVQDNQYIIKFDVVEVNLTPPQVLEILWGTDIIYSNLPTVGSYAISIPKQTLGEEFSIGVQYVYPTACSIKIDNVSIRDIQHEVACQYNFLPSEDVVCDYTDLADPFSMLHFHGDFAKSNVLFKIDNDLIT